MDRLVDEWVLRFAEELTQIIPVGQLFVKRRASRHGPPNEFGAWYAKPV